MNTSLNRETMLRLSESQSISRVDEKEGVILDFEDKYFRALNETALFILESLQASKSGLAVEELLQRLLNDFDAKESDLEKDTFDFLELCLQKGIVEVIHSDGKNKA